MRCSTPVSTPPSLCTRTVAPRLGARPFGIGRTSHSATRRAVMAAASDKNLLVVGPGVLGGYLGKLWIDQHVQSQVIGQTNTTNNHERLQKLGLTPALKADTAGKKYPYVAFCAPPSGSSDYAAEVEDSLARWDGTGNYVFTSSFGVCKVDDGSEVREPNIPLAPLGAEPRLDKILLAEQAVLKAGGSVVRLVGLYHAQRGAHTFFLKQGQVERWGGYTVNLLHYEDAASITAAILRGEGAADGTYRGRAFLGCDNHPITFQAMMAACASSPVYGNKATTFTLPEGPSKGKRVFNDETRRQLHWQPKYESFEKFVADGAKDWYTTSGMF